MNKFCRLLSILFLIALLSPAYAQATATFYVEHPATVYVGQQFQVTIRLGVNSTSDVYPVLNKVCALNYCLLYDDGIVSMVNPPPFGDGGPTIPCCHPGDPGCFVTDTNCNIDDETCITIGPVDGGFVQTPPPTCEDCTVPGFPAAYNCCATCALPQCTPPDVNVLFANVADPVFQTCATTVPFSPRLVSTLTFEAHTAGCFTFAQNPDCLSSVGDCDTGDETIASLQNVPPGQFCVLSRPGIPAFSILGLVLFALLIAGAFVLITRKMRGTTLVLLACAGLACGLLCGESAHALECPPDCLQYNLDINQNGFVTSTDALLVYKCIKDNGPCNDSMDVNHDQVINTADYEIITTCIKKGCCKVK